MSGRARVFRPAVAVVAATLVALPLVAGLRPQAVRAADPPEYHAVAIGLAGGTNYITVINESGEMAGYTTDNHLARITAQTVTSLGGPQNGTISGISDDGTLIGYQNDRAIRVDGTTVTPLPGSGDMFGYAAAINATGTMIVGYSQTTGGQQLAWVDVAGTTTPLPALDSVYTNSSPIKVNDAGLIAGGASDPTTGESRIVTWQNGVITDLGDFGAPYSGVVDMNEDGDILVIAQSATGNSRPVVWDGTTAIDLVTLGGQYQYASDINNVGQVAFSSQDLDGHVHAFTWENGSLDDLGTLGGSEAWASGINDDGLVTGTSTTTGGLYHGFIAQDGVMYDVNDLLPAHSVEITSTDKITNSGYILASSDSGPVLLVPGPTPTARFSVTDVTEALGIDHDLGGSDVNAARQVAGAADKRPYWFDGTTAHMLFTDYTMGIGRAINESGTVVGTASPTGTAEAFRFDGTTVQFLGTLGGQSWANDVNDAGDIVGGSEDASGRQQAFLYRGGVMSPIPILNGNASDGLAINGAGMSIGYSYTAPYNGQQASAFVSDGTTTTNLGDLGGGYSFPYAINENGEIAGFSRTASQADVAFWYHDGTMTNINPGGASTSYANDINESGVVVGQAMDVSGSWHAFTYDHGVSTPIPDAGWVSTSPAAISDRGQVVGSGQKGTASRAFLFDDGDVVDLNDAIPSGYEAVINYATRINEDGTILASAMGAHHKSRVVLLVPTTPLPPLPPPPVHATPAHPTVATVTSPNPGAVTVTEAATNDPPPVGSGYTFLGHQLDITAPASDPAHPISIVVKVDASLLASVDPDLTAADVAVFRNGVVVAGCTPSGADDPATPDPCVSDRATLSGGSDAGDAQITILTSAASHWNVGFVATAPGAPTGVTAVRGDKQATVSWTAAADNRSPISGYTVTSTPGNKTATVGGTATSAIVTGLTNGTAYTFTVKATNGIGQGPASTPSNAVTPGVLLNQTITFAKPANQYITTPSFTVTPAPTSTSGLPVTLSSTSPSICTVSGLDISLLAVGTCAITASQAGDGTYKAATLNRTFTISLAPQKITFVKPANVMIWATPMEIIASVDSGLPITLTTATPAVCVPAGGMYLQFAGPGTCSVTASQPGDATHSAATPVLRTFTVSRGTQTITFPKPAVHNVLDAPFDVTATSSSGQTVTMTSNSTSICTVTGLTVTVSAVGTCSLTATVPVSFYYDAAPPLTRTFNVTKAPQTITIPDPGPQSLGAHTVVLAPTASSGLTVTLTTQTAAVCTVSGNTVTLVKVGICKIKGTQAGNAIYDPAPAIVRQFTITS